MEKHEPERVQNSGSGAPVKKAYCTPRLIEHGSILQWTRGIFSINKDTKTGRVLKSGT
jgi:hypothetical protein